jgi:hypothetical protein
VETRIRFVGNVPYEHLGRYINLFDVALSTQTNNLVGRVRTTGKLPLYLACGIPVFASRVGAAGDLLPEPMLVDYEDVGLDGIDIHYPERLAYKIRSFWQMGGKKPYPDMVALSRQFSYPQLATQLMDRLITLGEEGAAT